VASSPDPTPAELSGKGKKLSAPATSASSATFGQSESVQQKVTTSLEDAEHLNPLPIPEFREIKILTACKKVSNKKNAVDYRDNS